MKSPKKSYTGKYYKLIVELFAHALSPAREPPRHPYFWKTQPLWDALFIPSHVISLLPVNLISCEMFHQAVFFSIELVRIFVENILLKTFCKSKVRIDSKKQKNFWTLTLMCWNDLQATTCCLCKKGRDSFPENVLNCKLLPWTFYLITMFWNMLANHLVWWLHWLMRIQGVRVCERRVTKPFLWGKVEGIFTFGTGCPKWLIPTCNSI